MDKPGLNMTRLKRNNRALILSLLHQTGPMSRLDISERTGLTPATISGLTREMIRAGIVSELGPDPERETTISGRKPILIDLRPNSRLAAGIVLNNEEIRVGLVNLRGQLLGDRIALTKWHGSCSEVTEQALALLHKMIAELGAKREQLLGIGVGIAGLVEAEKGKGIYPNYLKSTNASLQESFARQSALPVFVDNNVKAMALGETLFGAGRNVKNLVFFKVGPGIGSAVVLDGVVYRGSHQGAGEIGHSVFALDGPQCVCGRKGCLEALASPRGLLQRVQELMQSSPQSPLQKYVSSPGEPINIEGVVQALHDDNHDVAALFENAGRYLGAACANLVNLFDPDILILHGSLFRTGLLSNKGFTDMLYQQIYSQLPESLRVEYSTLGKGLEVIGAGSLALDRFFFSHRFELASVQDK